MTEIWAKSTSFEIHKEESSSLKPDCTLSNCFECLIFYSGAYLIALTVLSFILSLKNCYSLRWDDFVWILWYFATTFITWACFCLLCTCEGGANRIWIQPIVTLHSLPCATHHCGLQPCTFLVGQHWWVCSCIETCTKCHLQICLYLEDGCYIGTSVGMHV